MEDTISATNARIHFGEVMRRVTEKNQPVIVERSGRPQVVILSVAAYQRLKTAQSAANWQSLIDEAHQQIKIDLGNQTLPPAEEILRQIREERSEQLTHLP